MKLLSWCGFSLEYFCVAGTRKTVEQLTQRYSQVLISNLWSPSSFQLKSQVFGAEYAVASCLRREQSPQGFGVKNQPLLDATRVVERLVAGDLTTDEVARNCKPFLVLANVTLCLSSLFEILYIGNPYLHRREVPRRLQSFLGPQLRNHSGADNMSPPYLAPTVLIMESLEDPEAVWAEGALYL